LLAPVPPPPAANHSNRAIRRTTGGAPSTGRPRENQRRATARIAVGGRAPPPAAHGPPFSVPATFWDGILAAAEHFGGLFAGGPAGCVWTTGVVPKLCGSFTGLVVDRMSKTLEEHNAELLLALEEALDPRLGVTLLGSDDAAVADIIRTAATGRSAINRIGRILASDKKRASWVGPERRPVTAAEIQDVIDGRL
jgi:hypothetical protein